MSGSSGDVPDLELRPSPRTWVLGMVSLAFGALTVIGEPVPLVTSGWLLLGSYFVLRAVRGRLFVSESVLWQRSAFTEKRLVAFDELADVVTHQTWPLKQTLVLVADDGRRGIIRLIEWSDTDDLLAAIRQVMTTDGRSLNPVADAWFADQLDA